MANGGIVYVDQDTRQLSVTDGGGALRRHLGVPALLNSRPAWSPDGSRIAVDKRIELR
jgi:Tol biopolymer transport system component